MTLAGILLALAIVPLLVFALPVAWSLFGDSTVLAIVIFVIAGLVAGHILGGPDPDHAIVLALSTASRHPAIAFTIAAANFPEERFGGTIVLYLIVSAIVAVRYITGQKRQAIRTALVT